MSPDATPYRPGARVRIVDLDKGGHVRTPRYVREKVGTIERFCGEFENPEERAYGRVGRGRIRLYRVRLNQRDLWSDYDGPESDALEIEIYDHWLRPVSSGETQ
jgi:nitrile hydratase